MPDPTDFDWTVDPSSGGPSQVFILATGRIHRELMYGLLVTTVSVVASVIFGKLIVEDGFIFDDLDIRSADDVYRMQGIIEELIIAWQLSGGKISDAAIEIARTLATDHGFRHPMVTKI